LDDWIGSSPLVPRPYFELACRRIILLGILGLDATCRFLAKLQLLSTPPTHPKAQLSIVGRLKANDERKAMQA
jgi:hypothetical protein